MILHKFYYIMKNPPYDLTAIERAFLARYNIAYRLLIVKKMLGKKLPINFYFFKLSSISRR
ncbi:hypothetical protein A2316_01175 [Candidatus Falkowbacteria bacterium RIFOXYB2_FULL_38_15]|nr:MAG: hypothetical protein A2316_01175 [Candidatus Falkowbacteria bacterium RIFOXYB2_FULL_38_15]OGF42169.1 MAG: hypothetical protein A2555_02720 [Candidatus Falkowbacteria bacterium RIFOXYD2_FULL_39_16]